MGENEQGGMLRNVVVIGLVAIIAAVVIFAVIGLNGNMKSSLKTSVQNTDLAVYDRDLGFSMNATNGMLDSLSSKSDLISYSDIAYLPVDPLTKVDSNYKVSVYGASSKLRLGIFFEMFPNQDLLKYLVSTSNSDFIYITMDYKVTNSKVLDKTTANNLGLDTARMDTAYSGYVLGARSDSYGWSSNKLITPTGDASGTIVFKQPKSKIGSTYEVYVNVMNMSFDTLEFSNLHISNANVFD